MRVLLSDPDPLGRRRIRRALDRLAEHEVVAEADGAARAAELARRTRPDVVVIAGPVGAAAATLGPMAETALIVVAPSGDGAAVWAEIAAGACGYLLVDRVGTELGPALEAAEIGGTFVSPPLVRQLVGHLADRLRPNYDGPDVPELTRRLLPRERETLQRLAGGQSTEEIAVHMSVAPATVRAYVSRTLSKLQVTSRGEAVALAFKSGLCRPVPDRGR